MSLGGEILFAIVKCRGHTTDVVLTVKGLNLHFCKNPGGAKAFHQALLMGGGGPWSVWSQSLEDKKPDDKKLKVKVPRKHCERQLVHRCFLGKEVKGEVLGEWKGESNWDAASVDPGGALSWLFSEVQGGDDRTGSLCPTLTSDRMEAFPGRSYLGRGRSL